MTKLIDLLTKRKMNENTTLENQDVLRKDKENNNDKVGIVRDVRLDGRESKQHKIALKPHKRARKAMEALASHLKKEVSSLRFLVEKENGRWRSLVGEEKAKGLGDGLVSVCTGLALDGIWIGIGLASYWNWIDSGLAHDWRWIGVVTGSK